MHESPNHWFPRLTATSPVATRDVRFTSIPAVRFAHIAAIPHPRERGQSGRQESCMNQEFRTVSQRRRATTDQIASTSPNGHAP
jgi:hypothetical protein